MVEKSGRIATIDAKLNPLSYTGPANSIDTRQRTPSKDIVSHVRGRGGIQKSMNGANKREVRGYEQSLAGRSMGMSAILQPEEAP